MALSVHNFHDVTMGLPPICVFSDLKSIFPILFAYSEQTAALDIIDSGGMPEIAHGPWFRDNLTDEQQKALGSVPYMKCPSRRSGVQILTTSNFAGPRGDYAAVVTKEYQGFNYWHDFCYFASNGNPDHWGALRFFCGPFRMAQLTISGTRTDSSDADGTSQHDFSFVKSWLPQYNMSLWQDGSSNQLIFGEKFIPSWAVGCNSPSWDGNNTWDQSYLHVWASEGVFGATRFVDPTTASYPPLARSPDEAAVTVETPATSHWGKYGFGSCHPKTVNFALGDGSVRAIMVSVPPEMIYQLSHVSDGNVVSLP